MNRLINNLYLLIGLALAGQAVFAVAASNSVAADRYQLNALQAENAAIAERIEILHNKIAAQKALATAGDGWRDSGEFVDMGEREVVLDKSILAMGQEE